MKCIEGQSSALFAPRNKIGPGQIGFCKLQE